MTDILEQEVRMLLVNLQTRIDTLQDERTHDRNSLERIDGRLRELEHRMSALQLAVSLQEHRMNKGDVRPLDEDQRHREGETHLEWQQRVGAGLFAKAQPTLGLIEQPEPEPINRHDTHIAQQESGQ